MKKLLLILLVLGGFASAQTRIKPNQLNICGTTATAVLITGPGGLIQCIPLDNVTIKIVGGLLVATPPISTIVFVDSVTPGGTVDGVNAAFTLTGAPNPAASLVVFRNGLRQKVGTDYTLAGTIITFLAVSIPQTGDLILVDYRQ